MQDNRELFAELTWTRRALEICRGLAGSPGEVHEEIYRTEAEVMDAVERAAMQLVAAGFVEVQGPSLRVSIENAIAQTVRAQHLRRCAVPVTRPEPAIRRSRFGGLPTAAGSWPRCGHCKQPMKFLLEFSITELPLPIIVETTGLLQIYLCEDCQFEGDATAPFHRAQLVRIVPLRDDIARLPRSSEDDFVLAPARIVDWMLVDDAPGPQTIARLLAVELGDATDAWSTLEGELTHHDKIGGWPAWGQDDERVECRACATEMRFVMQLDEHFSERIQSNSQLYVFQCPTCAALTSLQQY
ncbi:MAG: DUF1963 domain-containing protein [Kofleriaceae bacterium]|nr:DUF1963 domain-containing protein [Kofleriaceae bacterium]